ncbi:MAG TPA: hypothetical protein VFP35_01455, partial [Candidatus Saccharimonadales bacterium]|nr:hypothetical protein [Candidatus Saccharimonadales bacterium]
GTKADSSTGNGDKSPALTTKTTFTLNCTAFDGTSASASTTVDVSVPPLSLSFTADSYNLSYGGGTTLRWTATNGNKCEKSGGGWGTSNANIGASGNYWTGGLTSSQRYYITCSGPGGTIEKSVYISVAPPTYPSLETLTPIVYGNGNVYFRSYIYPRGYPTRAWYQWGISPSLTGCQLTTSAFSEPGVNYWIGDTRFGSWWGNGTPVNYYNCDSWVYYYRVCAYNTSNYATVCGNTVRFGLLAPYVSTGGSTHDTPPGVSNSSGWELYGSIDPNGNNIDSCWFQWDNDSDLNNGERNTSCSYLPGSGTSYVGVTTHIDLDWYYRGEEDNRYFYYRLCAYTSVGLGTRCGSVRYFHTR